MKACSLLSYSAYWSLNFRLRASLSSALIIFEVNLLSRPLICCLLTRDFCVALNTRNGNCEIPSCLEGVILNWPMERGGSFSASSLSSFSNVIFKLSFLPVRGKFSSPLIALLSTACALFVKLVSDYYCSLLTFSG